MKTMSLLVLFFFGFSAHANVIEVTVCGTHKIAADESHSIEVRSCDLDPARYDLFATNQVTARLLESMLNNQDYCLVGGFNPTRSDEGISLISLK